MAKRITKTYDQEFKSQAVLEEKMHILSVLDIKKMIPVPEDSFTRIIFSELEDEHYKDLFEKEYAFCLKIKDKILIKAREIYMKQKETMVIKQTYCNFAHCKTTLVEWGLGGEE